MSDNDGEVQLVDLQESAADDAHLRNGANNQYMLYTRYYYINKGIIS